MLSCIRKLFLSLEHPPANPGRSSDVCEVSWLFFSQEAASQATLTNAPRGLFSWSKIVHPWSTRGGASELYGRGYTAGWNPLSLGNDLLNCHWNPWSSPYSVQAMGYCTAQHRHLTQMHQSGVPEWYNLTTLPPGNLSTTLCWCHHSLPYKVMKVSTSNAQIQCVHAFI